MSNVFQHVLKSLSGGGVSVSLFIIRFIRCFYLSLLMSLLMLVPDVGSWVVLWTLRALMAFGTQRARPATNFEPPRSLKKDHAFGLQGLCRIGPPLCFSREPTHIRKVSIGLKAICGVGTQGKDPMERDPRGGRGGRRERACYELCQLCAVIGCYRHLNM